MLLEFYAKFSGQIWTCAVERGKFEVCLLQSSLVNPVSTYTWEWWCEVPCAMASQEDGEEKVVKYEAGDKKLDTKDDSKDQLKSSPGSKL